MLRRRLARFRPAVERLEDRLLLTTWPVPASHEMLTSFGAGAPGNLYGFHEGIDILADGQGGQAVVAARAGTVLWVNPALAGGLVTIDVDLGAGVHEYDSYLHIENIAVVEGAAIAEGDAVGDISTTHPGPTHTKPL
jgi:murein DD-endopeptidase MepM/ murein hydrolase activator NlpD